MPSPHFPYRETTVKVVDTLGDRAPAALALLVVAENGTEPDEDPGLVKLLVDTKLLLVDGDRVRTTHLGRLVGREIARRKTST